MSGDAQPAGWTCNLRRTFNLGHRPARDSDLIALTEASSKEND